MRTEEQIKERREQIKEEIARNFVWEDSVEEEPTSKRRRVILKGKLDEHEWLSGEDIDIKYGVTHL